MTLKLSKRQQYVLYKAYEYHMRDWNYGYVTTSRCGDSSISPNTCKALVKLGLLAEGSARNEFTITDAGLRLVRGGTLVNRNGRVLPGADTREALARWNAAARGKGGVA